MHLREGVDRLSWAGGTEAQRAGLQREITCAVNAALGGARSYSDVYGIADAVAELLKARGFALCLVDEDDESMVTFLEPLDAGAIGVVVEFTWDDDEGASSYIRFPEPTERSGLPGKE